MGLVSFRFEHQPFRFWCFSPRLVVKEILSLGPPTTSPLLGLWIPAHGYGVPMLHDVADHPCGIFLPSASHGLAPCNPKPHEGPATSYCPTQPKLNPSQFLGLGFSVQIVFSPYGLWFNFRITDFNARFFIGFNIFAHHCLLAKAQ